MVMICLLAKREVSLELLYIYVFMEVRIRIPASDL